MIAIVEATDTGACVLLNGTRLTPSYARDLAEKLIKCAHECDKRRRRLRYPKAILDANDLARHVAEHDAR